MRKKCYLAKIFKFICKKCPGYLECLWDKELDDFSNSKDFIKGD